MAKSLMTVANNELILKSRDKNNNLKIKSPDASAAKDVGITRCKHPSVE